MDASPKAAYIVSHTHWDREWYLSFSEFRVDLLRVMQGVLSALEEKTEFRHFVLDGQAIVLEDHLEIHPEDGERIGRLCAAGALSLGPWYILPDEFLVSGEATARNLLYGALACRPYGEPQKVGYLPDSFGHLAQMPQILRLAGIDSFIYTRGNNDEAERCGLEFLWEAPDGSEVLAINQCEGYCNAGGLGHEELWHAHTNREVGPARAVERVRELFAKMAEQSSGDVWLLNNGCDHFPRQKDFGRILAALREAYPRTEFRHASFRDYVDAVRAAGFAERRYRGELLGGKRHPILSGVWSARMYLKQANDVCQNLLQNYLEPVCAAASFARGQSYPGGMIHHAWKLLLANHPHDSICGCSTVEVHREMESRFCGVQQTAERLLGGEMAALAPRFARRPEGDRDTVLTVLNPLPLRRSEVVERLVVLQPFGYDPSRLRLYDEAGRELPAVLSSLRFVERFWGIDYRAQLAYEDQQERFAVYTERFPDRVSTGELPERDLFFKISFRAEDLPALGHANFYLREAPTDEEAPSLDDAVTASCDDELALLENSLLRVELRPNGSFDLHDKRDGRVYRNLGCLEDGEDVGDEYDYSSGTEPLTLRSDPCTGELRVAPERGLVASAVVEFDFPLPARIGADRRQRARERVSCPVRTTLTLRSGSPVLDIETRFVNRAEDHRLRALFPTPLRTGELLSDGQFLISPRPLRPPRGEDWVQPHPGTYPQQDYSLLQDESGGLALLVRGLPEVEAFCCEDGGAGLALTLLRAVGWLSRDDFESRRRMNAGPTLFTPEAQCLGPQRFRYALLPYQGDHLAAGVKDLSQRWRVPPLSGQGVLDGHIPGAGDFLRKGDGPTCVSAVKRHCERDTLVVRLYNLSDRSTRETLHSGLALRSAWRLDLLEQRGEELPLPGPNEVALALRPHEIATLELEFEGSGD